MKKVEIIVIRESWGDYHDKQTANLHTALFSTGHNSMPQGRVMRVQFALDRIRGRNRKYWGDYLSGRALAGVVSSFVYGLMKRIRTH